MTQKTTQKKTVRNSTTQGYVGDNPASVGGYRVLGQTKDGVRILAPKGKSESFTVTELKKAIRSVRTGKVA